MCLTHVCITTETQILIILYKKLTAQKVDEGFMWPRPGKNELCRPIVSDGTYVSGYGQVERQTKF